MGGHQEVLVNVSGSHFSSSCQSRVLCLPVCSEKSTEHSSGSLACSALISSHLVIIILALHISAEKSFHAHTPLFFHFTGPRPAHSGGTPCMSLYLLTLFFSSSPPLTVSSLFHHFPLISLLPSSPLLLRRLLSISRLLRRSSASFCPFRSLPLLLLRPVRSQD